MKWGVRKDDRKTSFNPAKGEGLNRRQQRLYEKSNQTHAEHRKVANEVAKKVDSKTVQREDIARVLEAGRKDVKAAEKYAKATGGLSKDAKANIRAKTANRASVRANRALTIAGALGGSGALLLGQPAAAVAIGGTASLA